MKQKHVEVDELEFRKKSLEVTFAQIHKQYGKGSVMLLGDNPVVDIKTISTGSLLIDDAIGIGGLPCGRIVEVFGPESSGKTTLALQCIAQSQLAGGVCAFIDAEHALDPKYAQKLGVNIDDLIISQPDFGEQALDIAEMLIRSGAIDIIVIDSVAALVPKAELEGEMGDAHVGLQARLMSQALRKLASIVHKSNTILLFINQVRQTISGLSFGPKETTSGGKALKFYASVRLDIRKIASLKKNEDHFGNKVAIKVVKNKVAPPFKSVEVDLLFNEGISKELDLLDMALQKNIVKQSGSWFAFGDTKLAQGREQVLSLLKDDKKVASEILGKVKEALKTV
jgi:recombination protein RecA